MRTGCPVGLVNFTLLRCCFLGNRTVSGRNCCCDPFVLRSLPTVELPLYFRTIFRSNKKHFNFMDICFAKHSRRRDFESGTSCFNLCLISNPVWADGKMFLINKSFFDDVTIFVVFIVFKNILNPLTNHLTLNELMKICQFRTILPINL